MAEGQTLEPLLDPTFSPSSFDFRPGRSAHDARRQAREYVADGYTVVVDLDLEKFLDAASDCPLAHEACWKRPG